MMMTSRLIDERLHFDVNYQQEISKKKFSCWLNESWTNSTQISRVKD
jgi:hypothetical protein